MSDQAYGRSGPDYEGWDEERASDGHVMIFVKDRYLSDGQGFRWIEVPLSEIPDETIRQKRGTRVTEPGGES